MNLLTCCTEPHNHVNVNQLAYDPETGTLTEQLKLANCQICDEAVYNIARYFPTLDYSRFQLMTTIAQAILAAPDHFLAQPCIASCKPAVTFQELGIILHCHHVYHLKCLLAFQTRAVLRSQRIEKHQAGTACVTRGCFGCTPRGVNPSSAAPTVNTGFSSYATHFYPYYSQIAEPSSEYAAVAPSTSRPSAVNPLYGSAQTSFMNPVFTATPEIYDNVNNEEPAVMQQATYDTATAARSRTPDFSTLKISAAQQYEFATPHAQATYDIGAITVSPQQQYDIAAATVNQTMHKTGISKQQITADAHSEYLELAEEPGESSDSSFQDDSGFGFPDDSENDYLTPKPGQVQEYYANAKPGDEIYAAVDEGANDLYLAPVIGQSDIYAAQKQQQQHAPQPMSKATKMFHDIIQEPIILPDNSINVTALTRYRQGWEQLMAELSEQDNYKPPISVTTTRWYRRPSGIAIIVVIITAVVAVIAMYVLGIFSRSSSGLPAVAESGRTSTAVSTVETIVNTTVSAVISSALANSTAMSSIAANVTRSVSQAFNSTLATTSSNNFTSTDIKSIVTSAVTQSLTSTNQPTTSAALSTIINSTTSALITVLNTTQATMNATTLASTISKTISDLLTTERVTTVNATTGATTTTTVKSTSTLPPTTTTKSIFCGLCNSLCLIIPEDARCDICLDGSC